MSEAALSETGWSVSPLSKSVWHCSQGNVPWAEFAKRSRFTNQEDSMSGTAGMSRRPVAETVEENPQKDKSHKTKRILFIKRSLSNRGCLYPIPLTRILMNPVAAKYGIRKPFRHEVFFAAASDSYGSTGPSMLVRKNGWMIRASLYQHRRTSRRSVKAHPRRGSKKDLVTPYVPVFLNKMPFTFSIYRPGSQNRS